MSGRSLAATIAAALLVAAILLVVTAPGASALSIGLQWSGDPDQSISEEEMDVVQRSGATFYRMLLIRARTVDGTDWSHYDLLFERAAKRGITILPYLLQGSGVYPVPSLYADWGTWVKKVIQRYGSGGKFWIDHPSIPYVPVNTWEVWNEPNKPENNPGGVRDPEAFAGFFVFTSKEIHAVQPGAQVLVGGLYLGSWTEPAMENYVSRMYKVSGMASAINGLAIHPYAFTPGQQYTEFANEVINIRTVLNRRLLGSSKPLWITELGWPVEYEYAVDPPTQAELLRLSFNWVKNVAASYNIQALTWHNVRDYPTAKWDFHCGLRDLNGIFRPAWYSFQAQTGAATWPVPPPPTRVSFVDAGNANTVSYWGYGSEAGWQQTFLWGHPIAAGTRPAMLTFNETLHIYYVDASRGNQITEWSWIPSGGWQQTFLEMDPVASGSSPSAVMVNGTPQIYFADAATNRSIAVLVRNGSSWQQSRFYGDPVAANSSPSAIAFNGTVHVYFADASKGNTIAVWTWGATLQQSVFYGDSVAANSSPSAISNNGTVRIYFADASTNNSVALWEWGPTSLQQIRLFGHPVAAGSSPSS